MILEKPASEITCSHCHVKFSDTDSLTKHVEDVHTDPLSKKYNCEGCMAGFDMLDSLYSHQKECLVFQRIANVNLSSLTLELR